MFSITLPLIIFSFSQAAFSVELSPREILVSEARSIIETDISNLYKSRSSIDQEQFQFILQKKMMQLMDIREQLTQTPGDISSPFVDPQLKKTLAPELTQGNGGIPQEIYEALNAYYYGLRLTKQASDIGDGEELSEEQKYSLERDEHAYKTWEAGFNRLIRALQKDPKYLTRATIKKTMEADGLDTSALVQDEMQLRNNNLIEETTPIDEFLLDGYALKNYLGRESSYIEESNGGNNQSGHDEVPKAIPITQVAVAQDIPAVEENERSPITKEAQINSNDGHYKTKLTMQVLLSNGKTLTLPIGSILQISNPNNRGKIDVAFKTEHGLQQGMIFKNGYRDFNKAFESTEATIGSSTPGESEDKKNLRFTARKWFELVLRDKNNKRIVHKVNIGDTVEIEDPKQNKIKITISGKGTGYAVPAQYGSFNATFRPVGHNVTGNGSNPARPSPPPEEDTTPAAPGSARETLNKLYQSMRSLSLKPAENISFPNKDVRCARQCSRAFRAAGIPYRQSDGSTIPFPYTSTENMRVTGLYQYLTTQARPRWKLWPRSKGMPPKGAVALTNRSLFPHTRRKGDSYTKWKWQTRSHIGIVGEKGIIFSNSGENGGRVAAGYNPGNTSDKSGAYPSGAPTISDSWVHSPYMMYLVPEGL